MNQSTETAASAAMNNVRGREGLDFVVWSISSGFERARSRGESFNFQLSLPSHHAQLPHDPASAARASRFPSTETIARTQY